MAKKSDHTPTAPPGAERVHGRDCPKVQHVGGGYLHDADDDRPYDVDGVTYCGRCHGWMETPVRSRDILQAAPASPDERFERHTRAVEDFLNELYAIMVDPCAEGTLTVDEVKKALVAAAIRDRDAENERTIAEDSKAAPASPLTCKDIDQIIDGIQEFIVEGDTRVLELWQPYIDKLQALQALQTLPAVAPTSLRRDRALWLAGFMYREHHPELRSMSQPEVDAEVVQVLQRVGKE